MARWGVKLGALILGGSGRMLNLGELGDDGWQSGFRLAAA